MCKNNEIKIESGRSMVEMLGTLAIIGVLSIGGIAGYSYGMDKWRANQTVNDIMLRGVDLINQIAQGREPNLEAEWGTKGTVYNMEGIYDESSNQYGIVVDGVPSRVCQIVGEALKNQATVYVNNVDYAANEDTCSSTNSNTMEFYFDNSSGDGTCMQACTQCQECSEGKCVNKNDGEACFNGTCQSGFCINNFREIYSHKQCVSDTECYGECEYCNTEYGGCMPYFEYENVPCDNGKGICMDHGSNAAGCVIPETCETNADCDKFGKDYYCGVSSSGTGFRCVQIDFVPYDINGEQVMLSRKAVHDATSQSESNISSQNACERLGMYAATITCSEDYGDWYWTDLIGYICQNEYIVCSSEEKQFHLSSQEEKTTPLSPQEETTTP